MGNRSAVLLFMLLLGAIGLSLLGCAAGPTVTATPAAKPMSELLKEAGFKAFPASTPQEMAHLQTCPSGTLMIQKRAGAVCYAFPDQAGKTMYLGDEAAYWRLQGLLEKQEQKVNEQRIESDPEFWNAWGHRWGGS
jgi:hypothetical protein